MRAQLIAKNGYVVVYRQSGALKGEFPFHGSYVALDEFFAVREDIYRALPVPVRTVAFTD